MFITRKIKENFYIISELTDGRMFFSMQLILGNRKAALIDAGLGEDKSLLEVIRKITDLPVALYITHCHQDHIGNADLFDEVHIGKADREMYYHQNKYHYLRDGEEIDLGGVALEACAVPGHSDGCFCFINKKENYALTGDSVNVDTWLCWENSAKPECYADTLEKFDSKLNQYGITDLYDGHSFDALPQGICRDMIMALRQIADRKTENDRAHHFEDGKIKYQHIYGDAKIIYDKDRYPKQFSNI